MTEPLSDHAFIAALPVPNRRTWRNRNYRDVFSVETLRLIVDAPSFGQFRNDAESIMALSDWNHPRVGVSVETREGGLYHLLMECLREIATGEGFPAQQRLDAWAALDRLRQPPPAA
jgi:hypothetical protein